jgi:hypothetical protein
METPMTPLTLTDTAETALVLKLLRRNRDALLTTLKFLAVANDRARLTGELETTKLLIKRMEDR